ncbi:MAG: hypothetical protein RIS70_4294 [Planctomycetota bacterium]
MCPLRVRPRFKEVGFSPLATPGEGPTGAIDGTVLAFDGKTWAERGGSDRETLLLMGRKFSARPEAKRVVWKALARAITVWYIYRNVGVLCTISGVLRGQRDRNARSSRLDPTHAIGTVLSRP